MKFTGKFILERDEINLNNEPDEKGETETRYLITMVGYNPADRQAEGRWKGTITQKKAQ